ncbi:Uncharacterized protein BM_BM9274 [Brugia malayi]|uniref:Uncharacterized protein n=1 Tax=Brugia malayi TaxID=6279 RepID=A0A4E9FLI9_BRUMA|nr:Uncharacterized protein BM_BM9274 [Brugia malayi]VIO97841.1 Uncharacterized protein BM_BM9274 [Brugia malayi]
MAFKIDDELINMIGDFANLNRSPEFKVKTNENPPKVAKAPINRQYSLNLAVGVSEEIPPLNEVNSTTRRQSTGKISNPIHLINKRTFSAPIQMKNDIEKIRKKHEKHGNFSLLNNKNIGNKELNFEILAEEETDLLLSTNNNETKCVISQNEALTNDNVDNTNDNLSINSTLLLPQSFHTKIINNVGHRGSIILINDDDDDVDVDVGVDIDDNKSIKK